MKRRLFAGLLALALCLLPACAAQPDEAPVTVAAADETPGLFSDVPAGADYAEAVTWCYEKGLMNGVGGGRFDPEGALTRATLATVLHRDAGTPAAPAASFADVEPGSWYADAVAWASDTGLMGGYGNGLFGTEDPVSVEMLSVILDRYLGGEGVWTGDPAKARSATRAEIAAALMAALTAEKSPSQPAAETGKILVAYFSATGTTRAAAELVAEASGGELFEITPAQPYTAADLNYRSDCRANDEQNDSAARPALAESCVVEHWDSYDVIFLGHPIWWGIPPKILRTFCESYDWTGKTVIGFCTSGGSPYSNSGLPELTVGATWKDTKRLNGATQASVRDWVDSLELTKEEPTVNKLSVTFNGHSYTATLAQNPSVDAFVAYLRDQGGSVTVDAHDYGSFEKVGPLGASIVQSNEPIDTVPGDLILYTGSNVCLYYSYNSWDFTRLGRLDGDLTNLKSDLGSGNVSITYALAQ